MALSAQAVNDPDMQGLESSILTAFVDSRVTLTGQKLEGQSAELTAVTASRGGKYAFLAFNGPSGSTIYRLNLKTMAVTAKADLEDRIVDLETDGQNRIFAATRDYIRVYDSLGLTSSSKIEVGTTDRTALEQSGEKTRLYVLSDTYVTAYEIGADLSVSKDQTYGTGGTFNFEGSSATTPDGERVRIKTVGDIAVKDGFVYACGEIAAALAEGGVMLLDRSGDRLLGVAPLDASGAVSVFGEYVLTVTKELQIVLTDKDTLETIDTTPIQSPSDRATGIALAGETLLFSFDGHDKGANYLLSAPITYEAFNKQRDAVTAIGRISFDSCDDDRYWNQTQCAQRLALQNEIFAEGTGAVSAYLKGGNLVICSCRAPKFSHAQLDAGSNNVLSVMVYLSPLKGGASETHLVTEIGSNSEGSPDGPGESQWVIKVHPGWNLIRATLGSHTDLSKIDIFRFYNIDIADLIPEDGLTVVVDDIALTRGDAAIDLTDDGTDDEPTVFESNRKKAGTNLTGLNVSSEDETETEDTESGTNETAETANETSGQGDEKRSGCGSVLTAGGTVLMLVFGIAGATFFRKKKE